MPPRIRVLLVDDNPEFLKSAHRFLSLQPLLQVVGGVTSGADALAQIPLLTPHLVLMDWAMPEMSGLEATRLIKAQEDAPRVVILTLHDIPPYRVAAHSAGADGFISKADWSRQLMPLVQQLFSGSGAPPNGGSGDI
jgi:DNA-binding NarL/FixJ family response regulator